MTKYFPYLEGPEGQLHRKYNQLLGKTDEQMKSCAERIKDNLRLKHKPKLANAEIEDDNEEDEASETEDTQGPTEESSDDDED